MKNKGIVIFLIVIAVVVVSVIVVDFSSTRPDKQPENPYALDIEGFRKVDPSLIKYKETKNFRLNFTQSEGIAYFNGNLYVLGDEILQVISKSGALLYERALGDRPACITVDSTGIFIGFQNYIASYSPTGELVAKWDTLSEKSVITSLACRDGELFAADAGKRVVLRFTESGNKITEFEGKHEEDALHGFIVPSGYFDLAFNPWGDLWVVNPGNHSLENYTPNGKMREFWKASSVQIDGFSGCCNPAQFTFLPDGAFVTSEKGLVRIKVYEPFGEFRCVVAAPDKFKEEGLAPEVATDETGIIYALDFDKNIIRVFEPV